MVMPQEIKRYATLIHKSVQTNMSSNWKYIIEDTLLLSLRQIYSSPKVRWLQLHVYIPGQLIKKLPSMEI